MSDDVSFLSRLMRESMELQAQEEFERKDEKDREIMRPLQVKVTDSLKMQMRTPDTKVVMKSTEDKNTSRITEFQKPGNTSDLLVGLNENGSVMSTISVGSEVKVDTLIYSETSDALSEKHATRIEGNPTSQNGSTENDPYSGYQASTKSIKDANGDDAEKGVKWCALSEEENFSREIGGEKKDLIDQNMKCVTSAEES